MRCNISLYVEQTVFNLVIRYNKFASTSLCLHEVPGERNDTEMNFTKLRKYLLIIKKYNVFFYSSVLNVLY